MVFRILVCGYDQITIIKITLQEKSPIPEFQFSFFIIELLLSYFKYNITLGFCSSCGKEVNPDDSFCTACGKPLREPMKSNIEHLGTWNNRPTGITILGILEIISGVVFSAAAIIAGAVAGVGHMIPMMGGVMAALGGIFAAIFVIFAIISFLIAGALFSGKRWGRTIVIIFSIIGLVLAVGSLGSGNVSGITPFVLHGIILYYMWRPHVMVYFNK